MICHIVMWKLKSDLTPFEKKQLMLEFQQAMHNLGPIVDGILKVEVIINDMDSSNMDMMLLSEFVSEEALQQYQEHPKHQDATHCLREMVSLRSCVDYPK